MRRVVAPVMLIACGGCAREASSRGVPEHIVLPADTLTINTTLIEPLSARVVDHRGRNVSGSRIAYASSSDSIALAYDGGGVQCRNDGFTQFTATSGALRTSMTLRCRIAARVVIDPYIRCMKLGDKPAPLNISVTDAKGEAMNSVRLLMAVGDTTVARLADGMVTPLRVGETHIEAHAGRRAGGQLVIVRDTTEGAPRGRFCS